MMNQEQFLKALQERITVLEQAEQQDILAEYAQHIELLMKDGLSEEEAIRDFGPLEELAAEILEAYHIDPVQVKAAETVVRPGKAETVQTAAKAAGSQVARGWKLFTASVGRGWKKLCGATGRFFRGIGCGCKRFGSWVRGLFRPRSEKETAEVRGERQSQMHKVQLGWRKIWQGVKRAMKRLAWLCWNSCLVILALPVFLMAFGAVLCLGLLLVLRLQGYPVTGMMLALLGGLLVCGALLGLCRTWIWHRRTDPVSLDVETVTEASAEEEILRTAAETLEERGAHNDDE